MGPVQITASSELPLDEARTWTHSINNILRDYPVLLRGKAHIEVRQPLLPIRGHEACRPGPI